jgi:hypothetical protein
MSPILQKQKIQNKFQYDFYIKNMGNLYNTEKQKIKKLKIFLVLIILNKKYSKVIKQNKSMKLHNGFLEISF